METGGNTKEITHTSGKQTPFVVCSCHLLFHFISPAGFIT